MTEQNILTQLLHKKGIFINKTLNNSLSKKEFETLFFTSIIFFAIFGFIIGINHSVAQAISSTIKVPILFIITSIITFPSLYFFLAILGLKQNVYQLASFILVCLTIISGVMAVFAPISFFFLITTSSYEFYKLMNVVIFAIAGFVGTYIFYKNLNLIIIKTVEEQFQKRIRIFLRLWLLMFGFIGAQLSYSISPFFGNFNMDFMFFNDNHTDFFSDILHSIENL